MGMHQKNELPEGWEFVSFEDVLEINPSKPPKDVVSPDTPVTFVPMPAVDAVSGEITDPEIRPFSEVRKGYTAFQNDDVIFAKITPCMENGKAAVARNLLNNLGFGSTEYIVFRSKGAILPDYLYHYIRQESYRKLAESNMTGSVGQKRVPKDFVQYSMIPLPPLSEQHRIVLAIEALFARLDSTKEKLDRVPEILKKFRESVLAAACDGRLTEEWREEYVNKEEISIFFESIKKKRMEYWEKENLEKFVSNGKMSQNDKWKQKYKAPENTQNFDSFTLPDEWISVTIEQIASKVTDGDHNPPKRVEKGVPHLTARNIKNWEVTFDNCTYISPDDFEIVKTRYNPQKDDLIITCVGTIGETAIVSDNLVFSADRNLAAIRLTENGANPRFVQYILNAPVWRDIMKKGSGSTAQPHLYLKDIRALTIPLPPLSEQQEIVRRIAALFSFADSIEAKVAAAREKTEKLRQSILAKAFSGELVETEAEIARREGRGYETAEILLERIKEERGKGGKKR
ncbi:hypothetical protein FQU78_10735 [Methanosarcina mazei]|uniref:Type I restriction modification DNA specificity domain-containing protein n=2 Tax=Methanosarcina mazei TaxID=2209 RepID=A0A6C0VJ61_METMZ|nr:hypothetical protein FQU78_10735 [Methanosarcina mazei]